MVERDPVEIGDLVFAKIKGYKPWPARVMDKSQVAGKFSVFFLELTKPVTSNNVIFINTMMRIKLNGEQARKIRIWNEH